MAWPKRLTSRRSKYQVPLKYPSLSELIENPPGPIPGKNRPADFMDWHEQNPRLSHQLALFIIRSYQFQKRRTDMIYPGYIVRPMDQERAQALDDLFIWKNQNPDLFERYKKHAFREYMRNSHRKMTIRQLGSYANGEAPINESLQAEANASAV